MKRLLLLLPVLAACAGPPEAPPATPATPSPPPAPQPAAASGEPWDVVPGTRFQILPTALPALNATASVRNPPKRVGRPRGRLPRVPKGFKVNAFAADLSHPRALAVAPNGDVFLSESRIGRITLLRDEDEDGFAETVRIFAQDFRAPFGLAFHDGALYVADRQAVWRIPYKSGDIRARGPAESVTPPGALGSGGGHWTRSIVFHPGSDRFYVAVGSAGNLREEASPRATVQVFEGDGSVGRTFASGLRNPVGMAFYPGTEELYVVVNERDGQGDELVPDYLTRIADGDFFGWPYAYTGTNPQPDFAELRPDLVAQSKLPDLLFRSHSAPLGMAFYDGKEFPKAYRGDAFVALHGSWNAAVPRGYMVVRVPFKDGRPAGGYEAFVTGFWSGGSEQAEVWGRPAGLAVGADGSLLIADDTSGTVWRVSYP